MAWYSYPPLTPTEHRVPCHFSLDTPWGSALAARLLVGPLGFSSELVKRHLDAKNDRFGMIVNILGLKAGTLLKIISGCWGHP